MSSNEALFPRCGRDPPIAQHVFDQPEGISVGLLFMEPGVMVPPFSAPEQSLSVQLRQGPGQLLSGHLKAVLHASRQCIARTPRSACPSRHGLWPRRNMMEDETSRPRADIRGDVTRQNAQAAHEWCLQTRTFPGPATRISNSATNIVIDPSRRAGHK